MRSTDGREYFFNERWYEFTGQSRAEAAGYGWTQAVHPQDWVTIAPYWQRCQETGEVYEGEVRYRRHDGEYRWHVFRALPRRAANEAIEAWYGLSIDIHDAKHTEAALRASETRQTIILETMAEGVVTIDRNGRFFSANAAVERILGVARTELIGQSIDSPPYQRFALDGAPWGERPLLTEVAAAG